MEQKPIMTYLNGRDKVSFKCPECGCNVFHHPGDDNSKYECNSCGALYVGE